MTDLAKRQQYLKHFHGDGAAPERQKEALRQALDIRKFEIELYWKRATYFWTLIAAAFAAYFVLKSSTSEEAIESTYVVACLGFVFSLAWYSVNRGSKAWQKNWEMHLDLLEDGVMGPLYKTTINSRTYRFWDVTDAYAYSPSKVNQILSLFVTLVWLFLVSHALIVGYTAINTSYWPFGLMTILTVWIVWLLLYHGQTARTDKPVKLDYDIRSIE